jgi:hypothetical protein
MVINHPVRNRGNMAISRNVRKYMTMQNMIKNIQLNVELMDVRIPEKSSNATSDRMALEPVRDFAWL